MLVSVYKRAINSYESALKEYTGRVEAGLQPSTPFMDLFKVEVEERFILCSIIVYLVLAGVLYSRMQNRREAVNVKVPMLVYNLCNVGISLYISVSLFSFKLRERQEFQLRDSLLRMCEAAAPDGRLYTDACMQEDSGMACGAGLGMGVGEIYTGLNSVGAGGGTGVDTSGYSYYSYEAGLVCNPVRTDETGQAVAYVVCLYLLQKLLELGDTFFFILRKSFRQVTFLHLFHHSSIIVVVGSFLPFDFSGDITIPILCNCLVHVLIYSHYILTALGVHAWWSSYLTAIQLAQFTFIFGHSLVAFARGPLCGSPDFVKVLLIMYMGSMMVLFGIFFTQRYILKQNAVDMCGVIKSLDPSGIGVARSWNGNAKLGPDGAVVVTLPRGFHHSASGLSLMFCYQLTPIGVPMPDLHVGQELTRTLQGHRFAVAGGAAGCRVSWTVTAVQIEDRVPH